MSLKKEILDLVGQNSTGNGKVANDDILIKPVTLSNGTTALSLYTYKKGVYVIDNEGRDNDFDDYSIEDQTLIYESLKSSIKSVSK